MIRIVRPMIAAAAAFAAAGCADGNKKNEGGGAPMVKIEPAPDEVQRMRTPISLKVGDPAPPLSVELWLKGEPVNEFKRGTVYVVEFWATWCSPCVAAIPHLNQLQKDHPSAVVIGVAGASGGPIRGSPTRAWRGSGHSSQKRRPNGLSGRV